MNSLKEMKLWLCWKYETTKDGRKTKVPYGINGRQVGTNEKYKNLWVTHAQAKAFVAKYNFHGIGFVIPRGYFFLDIDKTNVDDPEVQKIIALMDCYTEISPSGKGIHIIGQCDLSELPIANGRLAKEFYCKNPHNNLELYIGGATNRYATFTENVISLKPATDRTAEVLTFLNLYMKKTLFTNSHGNNPKSNFNIFSTKAAALGAMKASTEPSTTTAIAPMDDLAIITTARAAKNGVKFSALYDRGDISAFQSQSNADQALCTMLAFYTGDNPSRIDKLFRNSALYRDKWERKDYSSSTISKAIGFCNKNFHHSLNEDIPYIYFDSKAKKHRVSCPMLAKYIRENLHYIFVLDHAKSGVLRYVYENGCYHLYSDDMFKGVIKSYITSYHENLLKMSDVEEVFRQIATDLAFVPIDAINANEDMINFQNGILHLSDMTLRPHTPDLLSTIQIPCDWNEQTPPTPTFDNFLHSFTENNSEIEDLLMEFMGVCLSNIKGWKMKKALFMVGPGNTGKSVLKSLTERLLGKGNYVGIDLDEIEARFGTSNLYGKRLAGSSDMSFISIDELKTFKKCTGGDSLFAEFKGQNGFEFTYNGLLWFCMNRLPRFSGDDGEWVHNRIIQVQCKNIIPAHKQNKALLNTLYEEREGIIVKAILALKSVIANCYSFTEPKAVADARRKYMVENNTITAFYEECMEQRENDKISDDCTTGRVYNVYKAWCKDNNHGFAKTAKEFREGLAAHLNSTFAEISVRRGKGGTFYRSLTLSEEIMRHYSQAYGHSSYLTF